MADPNRRLRGAVTTEGFGSLIGALIPSARPLRQPNPLTVIHGSVSVLVGCSCQVDAVTASRGSPLSHTRPVKPSPLSSRLLPLLLSLTHLLASNDQIYTETDRKVGIPTDTCTHTRTHARIEANVAHSQAHNTHAHKHTNAHINTYTQTHINIHTSVHIYCLSLTLNSRISILSPEFQNL